MCGRSSGQTPAPTTVSGLGAETLARTSRGPVPSAGSNTAWTWACTAVACSCRSTPRGSRRPVAVPVAGAAARAGQRQQQRARPQVRPAPGRDAFGGRGRAGRGEFGGEAVQERRQAAQGRDREQGRDDRRRPGDRVVVQAPPPRAGQVAQPGAAGRQQVRRLLAVRLLAVRLLAVRLLAVGGGDPAGRSPPRSGPSARHGPSRAPRCAPRPGPRAGPRSRCPRPPSPPPPRPGTPAASP